MLALGMIKSAPSYQFKLDKSLENATVIILGAGLTGLTAAYELKKLGYNCIVLEARDRIGGRCWSVRRGDKQTETNNEDQISNFDSGLYFNAGPSRIPHHHQLTMQYCKELGVPLEVYNNINQAAFFYSEGNGALTNKRIRKREIQYDIKGNMSELLAKAINHDSLDMPMSQDDIIQIMDYLKAEGALNTENKYLSSSRRGYAVKPSVSQGKVSEPYHLNDIISSGFMKPDFYNVPEYTYELQMTMFQPIGGMDKIAYKIADQINHDIKLNTEIISIKNTENGVSILYKNKDKENLIEGDYCICTIPLSVLSYINSNFSATTRRAIDYASYNKTGKIGLQFKRRFWEEDDGIYGGITNTNNQIQQIFYPSNNYQSDKGILIGYYNFGEHALELSKLSHKEREDFALKKGALIHPQYEDEFEKSFSISWDKTTYSLGGWAQYNSTSRKEIYNILRIPDKNVYFAGEHMTYLNAWMAGSFESARTVVSELHSRVTGQRFEYPISK